MTDRSPRLLSLGPHRGELGIGLDPESDRARLQAEPVFQADLQAARQEVEATRVRQAQPNGNCILEEAALANRP